MVSETSGMASKAHIGIKGLVVDADTGKRLSNAVIHVKNVTDGRNIDIQHDVTSVHGGDYWRLLPPGEYIVSARLDGYIPISKRVIVVDKGHEEADRLDFYLQPIPPMDLVPLPDNSMEYDSLFDGIEEPRSLRKRWFYGINLYKRSALRRKRRFAS